MTKKLKQKLRNRKSLRKSRGGGNQYTQMLYNFEKNCNFDKTFSIGTFKAQIFTGPFDFVRGMTENLAGDRLGSAPRGGPCKDQFIDIRNKYWALYGKYEKDKTDKPQFIEGHYPILKNLLKKYENQEPQMILCYKIIIGCVLTIQIEMNKMCQVCFERIDGNGKTRQYKDFGDVLVKYFIPIRDYDKSSNKPLAKFSLIEQNINPDDKFNTSKCIDLYNFWKDNRLNFKKNIGTKTIGEITLLLED